MSKKIIVNDWMDRKVELGRDEYIEKFVDSAYNALYPLAFEYYEEVDAIKASIAELAGKNFDRIAAAMPEVV